MLKKSLLLVSDGRSELCGSLVRLGLLILRATLLSGRNTVQSSRAESRCCTLLDEKERD